MVEVKHTTHNMNYYSIFVRKLFNFYVNNLRNLFSDDMLHHWHSSTDHSIAEQI